MDDVEKRTRHKLAVQKYLRNHQGACIDCGKLISPKSTRCRGCNNRFTVQSPKRLNKTHPKGADSPNWRGGRHFVNGYPAIYMPEHPRALQGYVREHWLIWEQAHGRPLPKGWIIHHLNGIRSDNRPVNLADMPNHKHYLVLQAKAKRIQELEALLNRQGQLI